MTRSRTPDVETLACAVAGGYAGRWARSVARLHPRAEDADGPAPWIVDGFAGADIQRAALRGVAPHPPAAAFVRAADEAFGGAARVVFVEEDPGLLARVEDGLRAAGAGPRLRRAAHPADAAPGDVLLVEVPFAGVAARLAGEIGDAPALVRLAPLSARGLPWGPLELLADLDGADLLLRVPAEDFAKAGRFGGPLADFPPHLRRVVEGCSALLADERHAWLLAWRETMRAEGEDAALAALVDGLRARLGNGAGERIARAARLESAGGAVHLLLTTAHPEHALELNGAVMDGGGAPPAAPAKPVARGRSAPPPPAAAPAEVPGTVSPGGEPSAAPRPASGASEPSAREPADAAPVVLDLFAMPEPPAPEPPRGPDLRAVADDLHARHVGRRVPFRELLGDLADAGLAPEQVRTALGLLKRERRAVYRSLDVEGAEVEFQDSPAASEAPPAPRPRRRPPPLPGVLGLFDDEGPDDTAESIESRSSAPEPLPAAPPPVADEAPAKKPRRRKAE